ncbi:hypothetical protein ACHHYP_17151 [Achlya hypogyna]|uniref:Transmembrane protein n=1 Tax=Achlya hypogyna TaxID=1202772 RepID=A0A1V9Y517_ACHHY|nr:hypothetical protein ACHHYP_17151 [Achlya hypogyna]
MGDVAPSEPVAVRLLDNGLHRRIRCIFFGLYTSQLVLQIVVVASLEFAPPAMAIDTIVITKQYIWALLAVLLLCLFVLYQKRCLYPSNLVVLSIYTAVQGVLLADIDVHFGISICLAFCVSFLAAIVLMGALSLRAASASTLVSYRGVAASALAIVGAGCATVNFGAGLYSWEAFLTWQGVLGFFVLWVAYVASRISVKFAHYLKHNEPHRVMLYYTDIMLFVFFVFSLVFSCIAFEGCACCGASDDIPGVIDFRFPLSGAPKHVVVHQAHPSAVVPKAPDAAAMTR